MYGKEEAMLMGEIWTLQKNKLKEIGNTSDSWWQATIAEFNAIADKGKDEDVRTCLGYHCIAALRDLEAKATGRQLREELHYLGGMTQDQFVDYLKDAKSGDMVRIGNKWITVNFFA